MQAIHNFNQNAWRSSFDAALMECVQSACYADFVGLFNHRAADRGLVSGSGEPLRFVQQQQLPCGQSYEEFIATTGGVPTRDNFHDRYNALMWLTAPKTKALLNRLQHEEIQRLGGVTKRGPVRDALTLWDENLAVVVARDNPSLLKELLAKHDWAGLFLEHRAKWHRDWHLRVFGHALMEKLNAPYKSITAHVLAIRGDGIDWPAIDSALVDWLPHQGQLTPRIFSPLPMMGVPGWCAENEAPVFYADASVFRQAPTARH